MQDLIELIKTFSLRRGQFTLASGQHSDYLIDLKMTALHPRGATLIADAILDRVRPFTSVDAFGGMAVGGVPLVAVVCARSGTVPGFFVRKSAKGHGTNLLIDGHMQPGWHTVLIEDVTTTGGSILQAVEAVRTAGGTVTDVITVVDRLEGASANLAEHGIRLSAILTRNELLS